MLEKLSCYVARVGIFLITVALIAGMVACEEQSAPSSEIQDWYDLDAVRDNLGGSYILMNDLDSTTAGYEELASPTANEGKGWQPIGTCHFFMGSFDGQGYEIRDLFINCPDEHSVGLFASVGEDGIIEDIGVVGATVTGSVWVDGLVRASSSAVGNSYSTATSLAGAGVGGLVGWNHGTVTNSYFTGSVTSDETVGGLVGLNTGFVSNSYSTGNVTGNDQLVGGLVGFNYRGTVSNSYATGSVTGQSGVGGLTGVNEGAVSNSYSTGNMTGNSAVGGLVGDNCGMVSGSFWDTQTSGQATSDGGTGKPTVKMKNITTFSGSGWDIVAVTNPDTRDPSYTWNIVDYETYPFLSWQA